jgi:ferredoxin
MKVSVDFEVCQSHGLCMQSAPEVFEVKDDGFLYILNETPPESLRKKVETAVRECPTGAIKLEG